MNARREAGRTRSIVVLTGAGISAESGLPTFRGAGGLWEGHAVEDVATPEGFARNPARVYQFYNERRRRLQQEAVRPNAAHEALARWESQCRADFLLITQNIDNLHERAGSRRLIHLHGELLKARCLTRDTVVEWPGDLHEAHRCACCRPPSALRPHVVWFGERPLELGRIAEALASCDLFVAIGTSGVVYPAAGFVEMASAAGAQTVEMNLEPSGQGSHFTQQRYGPASDVVPAFVDAFLGDGRRRGPVS